MTDATRAESAPADAPPETPEATENASVYQPDRRPDGDVLVSPRYLAGGGSEADAALDSLAGKAGWNSWADELANCHLTSPCGRGYLGFLPESNPEPVGLWKAWARRSHHGSRTWMAAFDDEVPYEFIQAFAAAWADGYSPDDPEFGVPGDIGSQAAETVLRVAREAGWDRDYLAEDTVKRLTAPDGRAAIELRTWAKNTPEFETLHGHARWTVWAALAPYRRPVWQATFTSATPPRLVAAFLAALTDPAPLAREEHMIPRATRPHITLA